ncbi:histidinol-phosphatase [candidate division KSB3 bacterium]|uniref:Histidinol-phosphatase n=1 Tax=candidate division KSB3 bacterium TaxID=2044937 RepID=A0A2G6E9W7_9BACT|nr:MAG: histidinol-phosphatase [candidate division KSB3 bacterium]PIE30915.1 MAG: histidinol-phosphatase [candidate division KSB3 bacterium]
MLDYHIHTKFCNHAVGEVLEYAAYASGQAFLQEIGFSDHLPMLKWGRPEYAMTFEHLPDYIRDVRQAQRQFPGLHIKLGIEADYYSPAEEESTREFLRQYPFDYVYGSVHVVEDWAIDDPSNLKHWDEQGIDAIYEGYFQRLQQAVRSDLFDIIAHADLVKKFGHRPTKDFSFLIEETIRSCKESDVAVEINSSGLRRPVKEIYPSPHILQLLKQYDIPIVFGSDAHHPHEIGKHFTDTRDIVKEFGFTELTVFEGRKRVGTYPL